MDKSSSASEFSLVSKLVSKGVYKKTKLVSKFLNSRSRAYAREGGRLLLARGLRERTATSAASPSQPSKTTTAKNLTN